MQGSKRWSLREMAACFVGAIAVSGICFPLAAMAREEARQADCKSRLAKLGKGCITFADLHAQSLPSNRRQPHVSWNALILPQLERQDLYDKYDLSAEWWEGANRELGATHLAELTCPAGPHPERMIPLLDPDGGKFKAAGTDYVASAGAYLHTNKPDKLYRGALASPGRFYGASNVRAGHAVKLTEITDGLSNSALIVEMADKPNTWRAGKMFGEENSQYEGKPLVEGYSFGQWVAPNWNHLRSYDATGLNQFGECGVNCSNSGSIYGFHPGLANVALADGSVVPVRAGLSQEVMVALVSIADGELITADDFAVAESP
ncbi:DUF1559 family PulG-like putative transporter [Blastopirellula retiformator]|uniref:DUF1559 domain-containing protein n=1 Tax=Blastopirellula retiformator TaxID=2527970 RepID=A0A5C5V6N2_9BACT|nr:DUF1559 domain-containing protein [Blastopirellula retiformator]TWT34176.1 hypothetical protein Enr8_15700 [Blastopirellula retiformator]